MPSYMSVHSSVTCHMSDNHSSLPTDNSLPAIHYKLRDCRQAIHYVFSFNEYYLIFFLKINKKSSCKCVNAPDTYDKRDAVGVRDLNGLLVSLNSHRTRRQSSGRLRHRVVRHATHKEKNVQRFFQRSLKQRVEKFVSPNAATAA